MRTDLLTLPGLEAGQYRHLTGRVKHCFTRSRGPSHLSMEHVTARGPEIVWSSSSICVRSDGTAVDLLHREGNTPRVTRGGAALDLRPSLDARIRNDRTELTRIWPVSMMSGTP